MCYNFVMKLSVWSNRFNFVIVVLLSMLLFLLFQHTFVFSNAYVIVFFLLSWFICFILVCFRNIVIHYEKRVKNRGKVVSMIDCNCVLNQLQLPKGYVVIYDNCVSYVNFDGYVYFEFYYSDCDLNINLNDDFLILDVYHKRRILHLMFDGDFLNLRMIYDILFKYCSNFDDVLLQSYDIL